MHKELAAVNMLDPPRERQVSSDLEGLSSGVISVRAVEGAWTIECKGRRFGSYATQESALWDAIATALQARAAGKSSQVDLHEDGSVRTVWPRNIEPPR